MIDPYIQSYIDNNRSCSTSADATVDHLTKSYNDYIKQIFGDSFEKAPLFVLTHSNILSTEFVSLSQGKRNYIVYEWNFAYFISDLINWIQNGSLESFGELQFDSILRRICFLLNENNSKTAILLHKMQRNVLLNSCSEIEFYKVIDEISLKYDFIDTEIAKVKLKNVLKLIPPENDKLHFNSEIIVLYHEVTHGLLSLNEIDKKQILANQKKQLLLEIDYLLDATKISREKIISLINDDSFVEEYYCDFKSFTDNYNRNKGYENKIYALLASKLTFNALFLFSYINNFIKNIDDKKDDLYEQLLLRKSLSDKLCKEYFENEKNLNNEFHLLYKNTDKLIDLNVSFIKKFFDHFLNTLSNIHKSEIIDNIPDFEDPKNIFNRLNLFKSADITDKYYEKMRNQILEFNETNQSIFLDERLIKLHCIPNSIVSDYKTKLNEIKETNEKLPPFRYWEKPSYEP